MGAAKKHNDQTIEKECLGAQILIVEDDPDICSSLEMILKVSGYRPIIANNGIEALEKLQVEEFQPSLILLDLMMPVMNGWTLRTRLLQDEKLAKIPVFVLSGAHNVDAEVEQLGVVGCLSKPFSAQEIINVVEKYC